MDFDASLYFTKIGLKRRKHLKAIASEFKDMNQPDFERSFQSMSSLSDRNPIDLYKPGKKMKIIALLAIKSSQQCKEQQDKMFQYFLENASSKTKKTMKKINKIKKMYKRRLSSDQNLLTYSQSSDEEEQVIQELDFENQDEISNDELDEFSLPEEYQFFSQQLAFHNKTYKNFEYLNMKVNSRFESMIKEMKNLDKKFIQKLRQSTFQSR